MPAFTDAQLALINSPGKIMKVLLRVDLPTPLLYCTGQDPVTYDSELYVPKTMEVTAPQLQDPRRMAIAAMINDADQVLIRSIRDHKSDWKNVDMTVTVLAKLRHDPSWTQLITVSYMHTNCERDMHTQWFRINGMGGAGLNPRAGLESGSRTLFRFPPTPIKAVRLLTNDRPITWSTGTGGGAEPPGGEDDDYTPPSVRRPGGRLKPDDPISSLLSEANKLSASGTPTESS